MRKDVGLDNTTLFELSIGKRVLKKEVFKSEGTIPLFSSNMKTPFGYVHKSNLNDFEHDYILWGIDGNFDVSIKRKGEIFATTDHCGTIKILDEKILPEYLIREFLIRRHELGYDRTLRSSISNVGQILVSIPVDGQGNFDLNSQLELTKEYEKLEKSLKPLKSSQDSLRNVVLEFSIPSNFLQVRVDKVFDLVRGSAKYTNKYIHQNKGDYPVFSSRTENSGEIGRIETYAYDQECLTWTMDGELSGSMFLRKIGRFNMTDHCGALFVKPEYSGCVDLEYVLYDLHPKLRRRVVGTRRGRVKMNVIRKTLIDFPIASNGKLDLSRQKAIAETRRKAYEVKNRILSSLEELTKVTIEV